MSRLLKCRVGKTRARLLLVERSSTTRPQTFGAEGVTPLKTIYPKDQIASQFGDKSLKVVQYDMAEYAEIVRLKPEAIGGLAIHSWNRIVQVEKLKVNPQAVAPFIDRDGMSSPEMVGAISKIIKEPLIKDISYTLCTVDDDQLQDKEVASLMLATVFPNNIHLIDVMYQNPYKPIPEAERRYMADHKGLGMLGPTLARIEEYARSKGCAYVTLTAAADHLVPLFGKYGYTRETNYIGNMARAMEKRL